MYILYNNVKYPCKCRPASTMRYSGLPEDFPAPVSGEIALCADDGFVMRTERAENYLRQIFEGGVLTLTTTLEPEEEPVEAEPSEEDDTASMLVDHEYRLTMLELGLTE